MKKNELMDALSHLDDGLIEEAVQQRSRRVRPAWQAWVAVAACVCLLLGGSLFLLKDRGTPPPIEPQPGPVGQQGTEGDTSLPNQPDPLGGSKPMFLTPLAAPVYPEMAKRPTEELMYDDYTVWDKAYNAWREDKSAQAHQLKGQTDGMTAFYQETMKTFLAGEAGENRVYSPLNVYLALSMLAETAGGETRDQIMDLLGVNSLTALREKASGLWNGVYLDDGAATCRLGNSLWLAEGDRWQYNTATAKRLAEDYYASTYKGVMGSEEYDATLQNWVNGQTDGLLQEQASGLKLDPETAMALASTICFRAKWTDWFLKEDTKAGTFHTANGDVTCDFLNQNGMGFAYFGENFNAIDLGLDDGAYRMAFFLPDEGVSVDTLPGDPQVMEVLQNFDRCDFGQYAQVVLSLPKFDVASDLDLQAGLKELGITDAFDSTKADFSGILAENSEPVFIDKADHAARVAIDEEGVTAAAYTVMALSGMGAVSERVEMIFDRPFMFAITGPGNTILFTGIVENP